MLKKRSCADGGSSDESWAGPQSDILRYVLWRLPLILLLPISYICRSIATDHPGLIEVYYSTKIYPRLARLLAMAFGWTRVSIAECMVIATCIIAIIWTVVAVHSISFSCQPTRLVLIRIVRGICSILSLAGLVSFASFFLGDLNHFRKPFTELENSAEYSILSADQSLMQLCGKLIAAANNFRKQIRYIPVSPAHEPGIHDDFVSIQRAFMTLSAKYPNLASNGITPKIAMTSWIMHKLNISGLYIPITNEVIVNGKMPYLSIIGTTCHELAHQRGFLGEDQAEYIGYLACSASSEPIVSYAVTLQALDYAMADLKEMNSNAYVQMWELHDAAVKADRRAISQFYSQSIEPLPQKLLDNALKAQGHNRGLASYSEMVRYLLAAR